MQIASFLRVGCFALFAKKAQRFKSNKQTHCGKYKKIQNGVKDKIKFPLGVTCDPRYFLRWKFC